VTAGAEEVVLVALAGGRVRLERGGDVGFAGMAGLLPTAAPPYWMIFMMWSSLACFCQTPSWKLRGCGLRDCEAGPSPPPELPWQGVQRLAKICLASAAAPPAAAVCCAGVRSPELDEVGGVCLSACGFESAPQATSDARASEAARRAKSDMKGSSTAR
jgi:hypothetical protein